MGYLYFPDTDRRWKALRRPIQYGGSPIIAKEFHSETPPAEGAKLAHFCSIKITREVREYAARENIEEEKAFAVGTAEKSKEFAAAGAKIYHGSLQEIEGE